MPPLEILPSVAAALDAGHPVVALESTIITHGMPHPANVETARRVERAVREGGAEPATIAVMDGRILVGLNAQQMERLAQAQDVMKLSRADMAYALADGRTGSTTVAATMIAARLAGIDVFATGGIGGVHRGATESFDISADLPELGRTETIVVCAGAKAILDVPATLEVLETQGVPVITYGSDVFPAFWSRDSGLPSPLRSDDATDIARHFRMRQTMGLGSGMLVANPISKDAEIPAAEIGSMIEAALEEATRQGVTGKAVTPFLLSEMLERSEGRSLQANIALIVGNAALAARIACALCAADTDHQRS